MAITSINSLVGVVGEARLLDPPQQDELVRQLQRQYADPKALAKALIERGWLTTYQIRQLVQGKGSELVLGQYVLLDVLGEGGMGKVYKARQRSLGRVVALKVIRQERLTNTDAVRRFQRETRATSQMSHPNIVRAVDADQIGDTLFIAMEYVDGIDLAKLVKRDGPLATSQASEFIRQAALGLQHAHECGLVHRDIKPSNLIVTRTGPQKAGFGPVKILDLGLARAVEPSMAEATATLTHAGCVIGTPDYISPEQARDSRTVDIRSDLYSLGCTLFYLLTGQVPFPGGTGMEKLFKHQLEAPTPLPQLRSDVPRGLVNVVVSLMAKKPEERPQTPAEAAVLLQPFAQSAGDAITVRPQALKPTQTAAETDATPRSFRTLKRSAEPAQRSGGTKRRLLVGLGALAVVGLLLAGGLAFVLFSGDTNNSTATQPAPTGPLAKATTRTTSLQQPARFSFDRLDAGKIPASERLPNLPTEVVAVLGEQRFRHWGQTQGAAFSPDGKWLATIGSDRLVRVWNLATGEQRTAIPLEGPAFAAATLAFAPNGQTISVFGLGQGVRVLDLASGKQIFTLPNPKAEGRVVALAPDGQTAVLMGLMPGDRTARLWHLGRNAEVRTLEGASLAHGYSFSADGRWVAVWSRTVVGAGVRGEISVWDTAGAREPYSIPLANNEYLTGLAVQAGGTAPTVAAVGISNQLRIWNLAAGAEPTVRELGGTRAYYMTFAPDGKTLAISAAGQVRLHHVATGTEKVIVGTALMAGQLAFSPDSRTLAVSGGFDALVRLWDVTTAQEIRAGLPSGGLTGAAVFAGDGRTLVTSSGFNGGVKLWNAFTGQVRALVEPSQTSMHLALLPDQQTLLTRSTAGLSLWDLASGARKESVTLAPGQTLMAAGATPNGETVATFQGQLKIWDGRTLQERATLPLTAQTLYYLNLSPDGQKLAAVELIGAAVENRTARVRLWSLLDHKELPARPALSFKTTIGGIAFSPDSQLLAVSGMDGSLKVLHLASGQEKFSVAADGLVRMQGTMQLTFSPDGQSLVGWGYAGAKVWEVASGKERPLPKTFQDGLSALAVSPDGQRLAACDRTGKLICWNAATGVELQRIQMPGIVSGLSFAPDGRHLATSNSNGTLYILRLPS
ncbi:MAG: protein kinase [Planctomycetia bacterium]|nr:protein kinase [Planctomycetia bacterium]